MLTEVRYERDYPRVEGVCKIHVSPVMMSSVKDKGWCTAYCINLDQSRNTVMAGVWVEVWMAV